jgi:acyl-CoA synthetase (AMP-forming)/AMP-acid ligase II
MVANVTRRLATHAAEFGDKIAIREPGGATLSFAGLAEQTARIAGGMRARGLVPGDRVLLLAPMGIPLYLALIACFRSLVSVVLVDPSAPRVDETLARLDLKGFIGSPMAQLLRLKHPSLRGLDHYFATGFAWLPHRRLQRLNGPFDGFEPAPPDLPALLTFTSGTTGQPKIIGRSHGFLEAQHRVLTEHMGLGPQDIDLPTLPVFLLNSLAAGATCILPDADLRAVGSVSPDKVIRQLRDHRCTSTSGSPAFYAPIAKALRQAGQTLPDLKKLFTGGARVPASLLADLVAVAPNARIEVVYGSTEAEPIATIDAQEILQDTAAGEREGRGFCVGRPVPGIALRIARPGFKEALPDTEIGEIVVSGDHVNPGYFEDPEADRENKLADGDRIWHRTGDTGYLDNQGRVWLVGRVAHMVGKLHPFLVEAPAEAASWINRAALVEVAGEAVLACEVQDPPTDWQATLLRQSQVDRVTPIQAIPLDSRHNAKIDRAALRRLLE